MPEIEWLPLMSTLVGAKAVDKAGNVLYEKFLKKHSMHNYGSAKLGAGAQQPSAMVTAWVRAVHVCVLMSRR